MDFRGLSSNEAAQDVHCSRYKVILVGEEGVGKTSIFRRVRDGTFQEGTVSTLGMDEFMTTRRLGESGSAVRLHLWDTAGSERFRAITKSYYHGTSAVVFVFSLDRSASLVSLKYWIDDARALAPQGALHIFVCNKTDLPDEDQVIYDNEISSFFSSPGLDADSLYRTSAKQNDGIQEVIDAVLLKLEQREAAGGGAGGGQHERDFADTIHVERPEDALNPAMPGNKEPTMFEKCCAT